MSASSSSSSASSASSSSAPSPSRLRVPSMSSPGRGAAGSLSPSRVRRDMKYVIVTGGVASGIGKGITISSIGVLLKCMGLRVTSIKIDPYLNIDAGTMSPFEHGEVFVLKDGGEGDLDLGNYERFLDIELTKDHNITTGKVYNQVLQRERRGDYLGKTVQVVPHVTNAIQEWIERVAYRPVDGMRGAPDICLVEVGGTVGDIESMIFLEALRQFQFKAKKENCCFVHVSLVPSITAVGEQKTKPTQHGVKQLMMAGLQPDLLVCRSSMPLEKGIAEKLAMFCHVNKSNVLSVHDVPNIYHVPKMLHEQSLPMVIMQSLGLTPPIAIDTSPMLAKWNNMALAVDTFTETVDIAVVGKYTGLSDAYLSIIKALKHSAIAASRKLNILWVEAQHLEPGHESKDVEGYTKAWQTVRSADGVLVPGGFGNRGVEGKILAANFARTSKTPYLGVCLGMQCAVIEFARNMCGLTDANSTEFDDKAEHQAIIFMPEINPDQMGGTMRLGERVTLLKEYDGVPHTIATTVYGDVGEVEERHRHRYEVNPDLVAEMEAKGLMFTGVDDRGQRMEIIELRESDHPFYLGTQYHPEFKTVVGKPSPPFFGFILAASGQYKGHGKPIKSTEEFRDLLQSPAAAKAKKRANAQVTSSESSTKRARR